MNQPPDRISRIHRVLLDFANEIGVMRVDGQLLVNATTSIENMLDGFDNDGNKIAVGDS